MIEMNTTPTAFDMLKYSVALGAGAAHYIQGLISSTLAARGMLAEWATLTTLLEDAANAQLALLDGGEDALEENYSTGVPVFTITEFSGCDCIRVTTWHPDPRHDMNRAGELAVLPCPGGGYHRLMAISPGEIETVHDAG